MIAIVRLGAGEGMPGIRRLAALAGYWTRAASAWLKSRRDPGLMQSLTKHEPEHFHAIRTRSGMSIGA
jgi:hypothetical protein